MAIAHSDSQNFFHRRYATENLFPTIVPQHVHPGFSGGIADGLRIRLGEDESSQVVRELAAAFQEVSMPRILIGIWAPQTAGFDR